MLTDLEMWSALVGALLPPLIAVVNSSHWSKSLRFIVTVFVALLASAITCWLRGELDGGDYARSVLVVVTATLATYHWGWKPSLIAPAIEQATSR